MEKIIIRSKDDYDKKLTTNHLINSFNVYCRVSTKDQIDNTSLDNQMELGIEYLNKNYRDEFKSIYLQSRPMNHSRPRKLYMPHNATNASSIDWRASGLVTPVKDVAVTPV